MGLKFRFYKRDYKVVLTQLYAASKSKKCNKSVKNDQNPKVNLKTYPLVIWPPH